MTNIFFCDRTNLGSSIGLDSSIDKKLTNTFKYASSLGMYSIQLCFGSMKSYTRSKVKDSDIISAKKIQDRSGLHIFSHMPYLYNLCGSSKQIAWDDNKEQNNKTLAMIKSMEYELGIFAKFNTGKYKSGCVVHPGNLNKSQENKKILQKGIEAIAQTINKIKFPENSMLLLENCAGEKNKIAKNLDELVKIYELVKCKENVGICIDTCHLYGCGEKNMNMGKVDDINNFFKEFDHKLGLDKLKLIHLNDSKEKFGSCKDRHEYIGQGFIWNENLSILSYFLDKTREIPVVLETCIDDYYVIQSL
jgi:deoxyribonuclease-4